MEREEEREVGMREEGKRENGREKKKEGKKGGWGKGKKGGREEGKRERNTVAEKWALKSDFKGDKEISGKGRQGAE